MFGTQDNYDPNPVDPQPGRRRPTMRSQGWKCYLCRVFVPAGTFHACNR